MEKFTLAAVIGAMMLVTAPAMAQTRMQMPSFDELDTDSTGTLTPEAFQTGLQQHREAHLDQIVEQMMAQANEDGLLDEAGLRAGLAELHTGPRAERRTDMATRLFSRLDRNEDGVIDAEEYARFTDMMGKRGQRERPRMRHRN